MNSQFRRKLNLNLTVQHIGNETLVYDESRHQAFCLNPTSAAVWNLSDGLRSPAQIAAAATLSLAAPISVELVEFALSALDRDGLLLPPSPLATPAHAVVSRRSIMQSLGATSLLLVPVVAAIVAPKAAQAYTGCFNCSSVITTQRRAAAQQADAANKAKLQQLSHSKIGQ